MLTDSMIEELTVAGERLYKLSDPVKGFYSGVWKDETTGKTGVSWNSFTGAKNELEKKLCRKLSKAEITILSLAVGFGPTPCLSEEMRNIAFESLWSRKKPEQCPGSFAKLMDVLCSFW